MFGSESGVIDVDMLVPNTVPEELYGLEVSSTAVASNADHELRMNLLMPKVQFSLSAAFNCGSSIRNVTLSSNPLRLQIQRAYCADSSKEIFFTLIHNAEEKFGVHNESLVNATTLCVAGDTNSYVQTCPNGLLVNVTCRGSSINTKGKRF